MSNYGESNYQRILNFIELIQRHPKESVKYFYFDDGKKFIVDGNRLKLLPFEYHRLNSKDEFYVHVNPLDKQIMYYAFDVENLNTGKHVNEEEGFIEWNSDIEDCIYNFFVLNIKELSSTMTPYSDAQDPKNAKSSFSSSSSSSSQSSQSHYTDYSYGYGTDAYKTREAFFDKLWAYLKDNRSAKALDHIHSHIEQMVNEKKYGELDVLLKMISFDKLTIPTMLEMLDTTKKADASLKERSEFFNKVKTHLVKIKPTRAGHLLRNFEPGKENTTTNKSN
jgi:hypothetical protein